MLFKKKLNVNSQIEQLARQAQQYPHLHTSRQKTLQQLIQIVRESGRLWKWSNRFSDKYYEEAEQKLWLYVCENIDRYNPNKGSFLVWINMLLENRFYKDEKVLEAKLKNQQKQLQINKSLENSGLIEKLPSDLEIFQDMIASLPEGTFKKEHIENYPEANFQKLIELRLLGYSWQEISNELGIKSSTLNSFYWRCRQKLEPLIRDYFNN